MTCCAKYIMGCCHDKMWGSLRLTHTTLQTTSLHKKISKGNLADAEMAKCMNALAEKIHKQEVPCTQ